MGNWRHIKIIGTIPDQYDLEEIRSFTNQHEQIMYFQSK